MNGVTIFLYILVKGGLLGSRTGTALVLSGLFMDTVENNPKKVVVGVCQALVLLALWIFYWLPYFVEPCRRGCIGSCHNWWYSFCFPLCVTACICFGILCSRHWVFPWVYSTGLSAVYWGAERDSSGSCKETGERIDCKSGAYERGGNKNEKIIRRHEAQGRHSAGHAQCPWNPDIGWAGSRSWSQWKDSLPKSDQL